MVFLTKKSINLHLITLIKGTLCFQKNLLTNNLVFVIWLYFKESVDPLSSFYAYSHLNTQKFLLVVVVFGSVERVINLFQILTEEEKKVFDLSGKKSVAVFAKVTQTPEISSEKRQFTAHGHVFVAKTIDQNPFGD